MERTNSFNRGKRSLENEDGQQPERKRPALASVIVEALKVNSLQKLCSSLEPILRRVVSEEVERALAKLCPAKLGGRSSPKRIAGPVGQKLRLHFKSGLSLPLFTGGKVEGEEGAAIHVVLVDANTGCAVTFGPESSVKLDVVVLEGDFNNEDDEDWTEDEFEIHVVKEREGKRPLLTGEAQVTLKEGVGTLGDLTFTDNSSWIRSRKFRLGLKVASGHCEGIRIREAKTEAFIVKDHRGELYKKHYPPALNDEVWRLEKIGKDGSFHKRLSKAGIHKVEDFLRLVVRDSHKLRSILGSNMSNKMWDALIEHAKTCVLSGKLYVFYADETRSIGVAFNNIYALSGLITGEHYLSADSLDDNQKLYVDLLVKKAYDNWNQVVEYEGTSLLNVLEDKMSGGSRNEISMLSVDYSNSLNSNSPSNHFPSQCLPVSAISNPLSQSLLIGGSTSPSNSTPRYAPCLNSNSCTMFDSNPVTASDKQHVVNSHHTESTICDNRVGLTLGPPLSSSLLSSSFEMANSVVQPSNPNPVDDWYHNRDRAVDEFFSEDEIRTRSHEMLENEDMQQLLRIFSMGSHASANVSDDGYSLSYMQAPLPNFSLDDRARSGKAVVGWLKIKAAMRWGFFIRKKAAERRAQLEELELEDD